MEIIYNEKVTTIIRRGLNLIDNRLVDHGVKVMLVMQDMLEMEGCQDTELKRKLSLLALFHDIGAYRTEEIGDMLKFEIGNVWEHSISGYLFLKEFTPLGEWANVVLYHHTNYNNLTDQTEMISHYAQMLHTADRVVVWHDEVKRTEEELEKHFLLRKGSTFSPESIDLWIECQKSGTYTKLDDLQYLDDLLKHPLITKDEVEPYLSMIIQIIDFRSRVTVDHTMGVMEIGSCLARRIGLPDIICQKVYYGAMLHDLGKIGTPVSILEKPGQLVPEERKVMRQHVILTGQIIDGCVDEETARIALRHHEKLNGSGYPLGLDKEELSIPERLMAVADIASALYMNRSYKESYSKEKCLAILWDMCQKEELDRNIVSVMETFFDEIMERAEGACQPLRETYDRMLVEYRSILKEHRL